MATKKLKSEEYSFLAVSDKKFIIMSRAIATTDAWNPYAEAKTRPAAVSLVKLLNK